jgi:hypothetical protein
MLLPNQQRTIIWGNLLWDSQGHYRNHADRYNNYSYDEWNLTLISRINQASADIYQKTLKGGGNVIEVSPNVLHIFDSFPSHNRHTMQMGGYKVIVNPATSSMLKIYKDDDKDLCRIIEVLGLKEGFKDEEIIIKKNYKYLLIKY